MKVSVDRSALSAALKAAGKFLPKVSHIAATSHFLVEARPGVVAITATDLESGRRVEVEAEVETEGSFLAPGQLAAVVGSGPSDRVELSDTGTDLNVQIGKSRAKLRLGNVLDYPHSAVEAPTDGTKVPIENWRHIQAVARCASTDGNRPVLTGVCFDGSSAVSTDSYRIGHVSIPDTGLDPFLVPSRAVLSLEEEVTAIHFGDRRITADLDDGAWWTRPIEGTFPKWRNFLQETPDTCVLRFDSGALIDVLTRSRHVVDSATPIVLHPSKGQVEVRATQRDRGEFVESFECEVTGEIEKVAFNPTYLRAVVEPVASVILSIQDGVRPARVEADWWTAILMPVRI